MSYTEILSAKLETRKNEHAFRSLLLNEGLLDFFSNDYLGFARDEELQENIRRAEAEHTGYLNGSTGSRLLSGNTRLAIETETFLSGIFKAPALLFNSGYTANVGVLSSIPQKGDTIIYDEFIHASIKDGARLSFADRFSFRHNDTEDLERKLQKATGTTVFIVVESIYSMDGDLAPLKELAALSKKYHACLIVDEAHSTGVAGSRGEGLVVAEGLEQEVDIRIHTFGKAMGIHGACVVAPRVVIDYLINFARSFIYTTAFSPHSFISVREAFLHVGRHPQRTQMLKEKISLFSTLLAGAPGYEASSSAIHVLKIPGNERVKDLTRQLQQSGFDVRPILSPTVKKGQERIRVCLHAFNTNTDIQALTALVKKQL